MGCCHTSGDLKLGEVIQDQVEKTFLELERQTSTIRHFHDDMTENLGGVIKNQAEKTFTELERQSSHLNKIRVEIADNIEEVIKTQAENTKIELKRQSSNLEKLKADLNAKIREVDGQLNEIVKEGISDVQNFVKENINDPTVAITNRVSTFIRENIEETLNAIKDLNLKQRVTDIVYPIFKRVFVHSVHGVLDDTYNVHEIIGQGSFSIVRKVVHIDTKQERACKILVKNSMTSAQKLRLQEETEILKQLDHPNIIRILEVIEDTSKINIITEICRGGELFERIIECKNFSENIAASYMYQILSGLIHIHDSGFIHRDLKPENILFVEKNEPYLKIIDFGIAQKANEENKMPKGIGTVLFI